MTQPDVSMYDFDTRLGAYGVVTREGERGREVLLSLWCEPAEPQWTVPGGGIEFGEEILPGLVRELYEETGYHVEPGRLLAVDQVYFRAEERLADRKRPLRSLRLLYEVTITGGELGTTEVGGTTSEARWIPVADVAGLPHVALVDAMLALLP